MKGTENIPEWELDAKQKSRTAVLEYEEGKITSRDSLEVTIPTDVLESGKGWKNKNTYKALDTDKHKNIEFTLNDVQDFKDSGNNTCTVQGVGTL